MVEVKRLVVCWETGQRFESAADAANWAGVDTDNVTWAIESKGRASGYHWYYGDGPRPAAEELNSRQPSKNARTAVCVETGKRFESVSAAARAVGVKPASIRVAIRRYGSSGGYHWRYADGATRSR